MVNLIWILVIISATGLLLIVPTESIMTEGNILTLIGICTTFIVGAHLVDVMRLRDIEKRIEELGKYKKSYIDLEKKIKISLSVSWSLSYLEMQPYTSFVYMFNALKYALKYQDAKRAGICLAGLRKVANKMQKKDDLDCTDKTKVSLELLDEIKDEYLYNVFKKDIIKIFDDLKKWEII